ncbi:RNA pseudouridine synthase, partial [Candidatus Amesbacteria bacterium]|nr:RNA pseudouridine synthase [Candidatus Amesbacteria bacterium]
MREKKGKIIFEDEWILVLDKPAGVMSESLGRVAHRLDKDTSGVLVVAKTDEAYENLKQQFLERKVKKTYVTLVHGIMNKESGIMS